MNPLVALTLLQWEMNRKKFPGLPPHTLEVVLFKDEDLAGFRKCVLKLFEVNGVEAATVGSLRRLRTETGLVKGPVRKEQREFLLAQFNRSTGGHLYIEVILSKLGFKEEEEAAEERGAARERRFDPDWVRVEVADFDGFYYWFAMLMQKEGVSW